jgi:hypothetical protein
MSITAGPSWQDQQQGGSVAGKKINQVQVVWAIALILMGLGVFYRVPQVMPKIEEIPRFAAAAGFIRFCFYFIGITLIGGGCKKLYHQYRQ